MKTVQTVLAGITGNMVRHKDLITPFVTIHPLTNLNNLSCYLMTQHPGSLLDPIPFHDIAPTDTTGQHLDQQFAWPDLWGWNFLQPHILIVIIHGDAHRV
jgi:hypothetical protein